MKLDDIRGQAVISVPTAAKVLGIGEQRAYAAGRSGVLPTVRLGRRVYVPVPAFLAWLGEDQAA